MEKKKIKITRREEKRILNRSNKYERWKACNEYTVVHNIVHECTVQCR